MPSKGRMHTRWRRMIEPGNALRDPVDRLRAELLAAMLLALIAVSVVGAAAMWAVQQYADIAYIVIGTIPITVTAYALARTRHYRAGGLLSAAAALVMCATAAAVRPEEPMWSTFAFIAPLVASVILTTRGASIVALGTLIAVCIVFAAIPELHSWDRFITVLLAHLTLSPAIVYAAYHHNRVADTRQQMLRKSLEERREGQRLEAVGRLAGGIAHDFNNLLTVQFVHAGLMRQRGEDSASLREIVKVAERAAALTQQLLAFARKQRMDPVVLDVNALLDDVEELIGRLMHENVSLEIHKASQACAVRADPVQLEQAIVNLVLNARDAVPDGGTVRLGAEVVDGETVVVSVADDGIGMDEATRNQIFDPFFTTKGDGGTGLGLASVHGIVAQTGGHITVDSEPGHGTEFRVHLPRCASAPAQDVVPRLGSPAPDRAGSTILLVEDNDLLRKSISSCLTTIGYRVLAASSGVDAVALVDAPDHPVDIVLTDIVMPGMNGRDLARRLRSERPGLRVLYMSGYDEPANHAEPGDATEFIAKPFSMDELASKVDELLDRD